MTMPPNTRVTDRTPSVKRSRSFVITLVHFVSTTILGPNPNRTAVVLSLSTTDTTRDGSALLSVAFSEPAVLGAGITITLGQAVNSTTLTTTIGATFPFVIHRQMVGDDLNGTINVIASLNNISPVLLGVMEVTEDGV